jgi:hypothetical protein
MDVGGSHNTTQHPPTPPRRRKRPRAPGATSSSSRRRGLRLLRRDHGTADDRGHCVQLYQHPCPLQLACCIDHLTPTGPERTTMVPQIGNTASGIYPPTPASFSISIISSSSIGTPKESSSLSRNGVSGIETVIK